MGYGGGGCHDNNWIWIILLILIVCFCCFPSFGGICEA